MKKLLVTGASGFLGWHIKRHPQTTWNLVGTHHQNAPDDWESCKVDLTQQASVLNLFSKIKPDAIFHLAANSSVGFCEKNPIASHEINVAAAKYISEYCQQTGIPLLFTSSEQVFDGLEESYTETATPSPTSRYGQQKVAAEQIIETIYPNAIIARLSVMYGWHGPSAYCFMTDWLRKWENGNTVTAFYDEIRTFLSGTAAADALFFLLNQAAKGIYNIGSKLACSRYDFAQQLSQVHGHTNASIRKTSQKDQPSTATRPPRLVLDCTKLEKMGFVLENSISV